jgi:hypothetical protein
MQETNFTSPEPGRKRGRRMLEESRELRQGVWQLFQEGFSLREIADRLYVTPGTVRYYLSRYAQPEADQPQAFQPAAGNPKSRPCQATGNNCPCGANAGNRACPCANLNELHAFFTEPRVSLADKYRLFENWVDGYPLEQLAAHTRQKDKRTFAQLMEDTDNDGLVYPEFLPSRLHDLTDDYTGQW